MQSIRCFACFTVLAVVAATGRAQEFAEEDVRDAIEHGNASAQQLALQLYYAQLFAGGASRDSALALARELEPYVVEPAARAEFQERVATSLHETGDMTGYDEFLGRMQAENPDPSTEWGFHAQYTRVFDYIQRQDYAGAVAVLEPLLPYADQVSDFQRGRIGVQLTNLYRNNGEFTKAITLAELTRMHLDEKDPRRLDLLGDLAASYYATENYDLAALTYDELATLAKSINPNAQPPDPAANYRIFAPQRAAEAREIAAAYRSAAQPQSAPKAMADSQAQAETDTAIVKTTSRRPADRLSPAVPTSVMPNAGSTSPAASPLIQGAAFVYAAVFSGGALLGAAGIVVARQRRKPRRGAS